MGYCWRILQIDCKFLEQNRIIDEVKSFLISRKTAPVSWAWLIAASQVSQQTLIKAVWQECRWQKPDWKGWKRFRSSMNWVGCLWICLSRGFVRIERRDIGLKSLESERSLAFRAGGKFECISCKHKSRILQRRGEPVSANMNWRYLVPSTSCSLDVRCTYQLHGQQSEGL